MSAATRAAGCQAVGGRTEELRRVIPVIEALVGDGTCVSVDTMKPSSCAQPSPRARR